MTANCSFCTHPLSKNEETNIKLYGKPVCNSKDCLDKANAEADAASSQSMPDYIPLEMIQPLQDAGWVVEGWSARKGIGTDGVEVRIDFKTLPLEVYTRVGEMPWTGLAEDPKFRHPKVQAELLKVQEFVKLSSKVGAGSEKKPEPKGLVSQEKTKPPVIKKSMTDAERDEQIELAKAKRFLEGRGSSYKVQGKERPDAHKIQQIANERVISIEIISAVQTDVFSDIVVRGHLGNQYIDACVHHDFPTEYLLKTMEIIKKNPEILDHYEGTNPVIKDGAKIRVGDENVDAKYYLVHTLLSFKKFSLRDARTKAASIAEAMLLNRDWRDEDEVQSELSERAIVEESIKSKRGVGK